VPCVSAQPCSWVFQWLELEPFGGEPDLTSVGEEAFAIRRDEVRHRVTFPLMAVQPESTVHCEDHPVETAFKLAECWCRFSGHAVC